MCVCFLLLLFGMFGLRMSDERIFGSQNLTVGDFLFRLQIEFQENSRLIFIVRFVYFVVDSKIQGRKNVKELKYEKNTHTQCYHSITMKRKKTIKRFCVNGSLTKIMKKPISIYWRVK